MKKQIIVLILALMVIFVSSPAEALAEAAEGHVHDGSIKVEAEEVTENSVKLVWNWDRDVLPDTFAPDEDATFAVYEGEDDLTGELTAFSEDNEDGSKAYSYDKEEGYSYVVDGLEAGTEYELEVRSGRNAEEEALSGKVSFTTAAAEPEDEEADAAEDTEDPEAPAVTEQSSETLRTAPAAEPEEEAETAEDNQLPVPGEAADPDAPLTLNTGKVTTSTVELKWTLAEAAEDAEFSILQDGSPIDINTADVSFNDSGYSYTVKGLKSNTSYVFKVTLLNNDPEVSGSVTGTTAKEKIKSLKAAAVGDSNHKRNYIKLSWKEAEGADHYVITWSGDSYKKESTTKELSYKKTISAAKYGKSFTFKVKAVDAEGNSITKLTSCKAKVPKIVIKAAGTTAESTKLTVTIPAGNKGTYKIIRVYNGKKKALKKITNKGKKQTVKYTASGLTSAKKYTFYVVRTSTAGKYIISNKKGAKTAIGNVTGFRKLSSAKAVILKWNKVPRATSYVITRTGNGATKTFTVKGLDYIDNTVAQDVMYTYKIKAKKSGFPKSKKAAVVNADAIRTLYLSIRFGSTATLTSYTGGGVRTTFPAGTVVTSTGFSDGRYIFWYGGREYRVMRAYLSSAAIKQINTSMKYTSEEATTYVNRMGLSSRTPYLIWVNAYTQHEYVFKGQKGNWQLLWDDDIATGRPWTPTPIGLTHIESKDPVEHGLKFWSCCYTFSLHGIPTGAKVNYPTSGSCVRNYDHRAEWIYYNCKIGTSVYIY